MAKLCKADWFKTHRYPPDSLEHLMEWWGEVNTSNYISREDMESAQRLCERLNADIKVVHRCKASIEENGCEVRCRQPTIGVRYCNGEHFCRDHV